MMIMQSLAGLILLLTFFTFLGLGVTNAKTAKANLALLPVFGYVALVGLSYIISANFKISGASAVTYVVLLLMASFLIRIRSFSGLVKESVRNGELSLCLAIIAIPIVTILIPALYFGFKYFYAFVNYDFFYNSQDSWLLQTYNVTQFNINNATIIPLDWSADFSGRIAATLIGAFFPGWLNIDVLQFNSLLLNTIVVLFSLAMSVFCKEFFGFRKKTLLLAVFISVMSASYVQAYCYYVFGQISTLPVFVLFCIYLKRFLDNLAEQVPLRVVATNVIIIGLLLNVLFVMYAILSFFALCLLGLSYLIVSRHHLLSWHHFKKRFLFPILTAIGLTLLLFLIIRIMIIPESISIFKSWIKLSNRVAEGAQQGLYVFIVCSEYLTEVVLALLFGITNYPSTGSIFSLLDNDVVRNSFLLAFGIGALLTTFWALTAYSTSKTPKSAHAIVISLFGITLTLMIYFFFTLSGYGIYKLQTWFMPILIPIYLYCMIKIDTTKLRIILKTCCGIILALNILASIIYLHVFFLPSVKQGFVNTHGVTGNTDIIDIAAKLKSNDVKEVSLFLTNGLETAWVADMLRTIKLDKVSHNAQPLIEKDFIDSSCKTMEDKNWRPSKFIVITNPTLSRSDIVTPPIGGKVVYSNSTFLLLDTSQLENLIYLGKGAYQIEYVPKHNENTFPKKFRWVEKGVEVMIYSNKEKSVNLKVEVTPGYVDNKNLPRQFVIKTESGQHQFSTPTKTTLTVSNLKLHQGLNCLTVESPDKVSRLARRGSLIRPEMPLDARLNNFTISHVGIKS